MAGCTGFRLRLRRRPTPPSQARSGEFLKTCRRHVFPTEFHLIGSNPVSRAPNKTKSRTSSWTCDISMVECTGFRLRLRRRPTPPSQARSGEFLKTCRRHVFPTEFHLIGSNPVSRAPNKTKSRTSSWTCDISMVECTGFEPVTSWLPAMRSTN